MKDFLNYLKAQDKEQLKKELKELYESYELVRDHYQIKLKKGGIDKALLTKYNRQVTNALYLDDYFEGGLDVDKVNKLIEQLDSDATINYYIEVSLHAIEECTCVAKDYGGDFGDEFYIYFEELYETVIQRIIKENLQKKYKLRLKEIADAAFEGYGHYDQLQDTYDEYIEEFSDS